MPEPNECLRDAVVASKPSVYTGVTRLLFLLAVPVNSISNGLSLALISLLNESDFCVFDGNSFASEDATGFLAGSSSKFQYSWSVILIFIEKFIVLLDHATSLF